MLKRLLPYLTFVGVLVIVSLAFYTYVANQYDSDRESFNMWGKSYLLVFLILPVVPTTILLYFRRKDGILKTGRINAKLFALMVAVIILYAMFTSEQYRLSHGITEAIDEAPQFLLILFIIGIFSNWIFGILIEKAFKKRVISTP